MRIYRRAKTEVTIRTLDDVVAAEGWTQPVSLLKIDVEGHEPEVLKGAQQVLNRDKPVVLFEVLAGPAGAACIQALRSCGYDKFFTFRRTLSGQRGFAGLLSSMVEGASVTISQIEVSGIERDALVCATAPKLRRASCRSPGCGRRAVRLTVTYAGFSGESVLLANLRWDYRLRLRGV